MKCLSGFLLTSMLSIFFFAWPSGLCFLKGCGIIEKGHSAFSCEGVRSSFSWTLHSPRTRMLRSWLSYDPVASWSWSNLLLVLRKSHPLWTTARWLTMIGLSRKIASYLSSYESVGEDIVALSGQLLPVRYWGPTKQGHRCHRQASPVC